MKVTVKKCGGCRVVLPAGACRGCGSTGPLVVDHSHETDRVRGLLCSPCNLALGMVKDSPDVLRQLASYLEGATACA